ncbi:MAG: YSC84-related protein [Rhodobacteraceae bacterium]|nr:YSC84-related protein [Paracoccaceae bacterium]
MTHFTRRGLLAGGAAFVLAACDNSVGSTGGQIIDSRVQNTLSLMYQTYPETQALANRAAGMLVMPLIGSAGFMVGGGYGEGALLIDGVTVDYYSATVLSGGFQIGATESSQVLFFLTPDALADFRGSPGWEAGAGVTTVVGEAGGTLSADTRSIESDVVSIIFNEKGLLAGATLSGVKYSRILR